MPKLSGVFDQFTDLDKIASEDVNRWLKVKIEEHALDNFIANRIYYPQTISVTAKEMEIDLAILKEAIRKGDKKFYNLSSSKIVISEEFLVRFYPLHQLVACFIDGFEGILKEVTEVYIQYLGVKTLVGSILTPSTLSEKNPVNIKVGNLLYPLKLNALTLLPIKDKALKVFIEQGKELVVDGGSLGIFIDLRKRR